MSNSLPTLAFPTAVPRAVLEEVHEKLNKGTFGKVLQEYTNGEIKLSMWIPADLAGRVIGKKGMVITNLQRETKARVINALPPVGDSMWISVAIIGDFKTVFDACRAITEIVEDEVDDVVLEFTINYRKPFFLYGGKRIPIIRKLSADTNVRVLFPEFNPKEQQFKDAQPVTLEGTSEDVRRAVTLLEREALLYQYQQQLKASHSHADKEKDKDTASVVTDGSREVKSGRRERSTKPDHSACTTALGAGASEDALSKRTESASAQDARLNSKQHKSKLVDASGVERILTTNKSTASASVAPTPATTTTTAAAEKEEDDKSLAKETTAVLTSTAQSTSDLPLMPDAPVPAAARVPLVKVERLVNIPTTLVGLLLSKRPKAKNTTINLIQLMTHTIISKLLPAAGVTEAGDLVSGETPAAERKEPATQDEGHVEGEGKGEVGDPVDPASRPAVVAGGRRRRRAVGGEAEEASSDSESDSDSVSDASDSSQGDSEDDEHSESAEEKEVVEAEAEVGAEPPTEEKETADGNPVEAVPAEGGESSNTTDYKQRMIAESEKLGFVSFRVVGFYQENVDMVVEALENIIKGDRIMEVTDQLKISARGLRWPPRESARGERPVRKVRTSRADRDPTTISTGTGRAERPERSEPRSEAAAEEAARQRFGPSFDLERFRHARSKRREPSARSSQAAAAAEGTSEPAVMIDGVSSNYKGKTPLPKEERDALRAVREAARAAKHAARAAAQGAPQSALSADPVGASAPYKRTSSKGPPRVPGVGRSSSSGSKTSPKATAAGLTAVATTTTGTTSA